MSEEGDIGYVQRRPIMVYNPPTNMEFPRSNLPPRRCHSFPSMNIVQLQLENEPQFIEAIREGQNSKLAAIRNRSRINLFCASAFLVAAFMLFWVLFKN